MTIKAPNCEVFYISINTKSLSDKVEDLSEMINSLSSQIRTMSPAADVTFSNGHEVTIIFYQLATEISSLIAKEIAEHRAKLNAKMSFEEEQQRIKKEQKNKELKRMVEKKRRRDDLKRLIECTFSGCKINVYADKYLCGIGGKTVSFRRSTSLREVVIDLKAACVETGPNQFRLREDARCVSVPEDIPSLKPSQEVLVEIEFEEEEKIVFRAIVAADRGPSNFTSVQNVQWVVLEPAEGENPQTTPYAIAWFSPYLNIHTNPFRIGVGVGGCYPSVGSKYTSILIDSDGVGLVEYDRGFSYMSTPEPKNGIVALAFETRDGNRYGPFRYAFDVEEIVENAAINSIVPKLLCPGQYDRKSKKRIYSCEIPGDPGDALGWLQVESIRIGNSPSNLDSKFDVNMTARYIIETPFRRGRYRKTQGPEPLVKFGGSRGSGLPF